MEERNDAFLRQVPNPPPAVIATIARACALAAVKPAAVTTPPQYRSLVIGEIESEELSAELKKK